MSDPTSAPGGFTGDPAAALTVTSEAGCCGGTPQTIAIASEPPESAPCCGTRAEATADNSCCGSTAKTEAVNAGQGCCG